uniref:Histidine N-acetyltransferase C-terminal domain-containing protein n=1 Tax=Nothobranchius furzeri TaxID=105023 RepID=A0A8C6NPV2_NOTFU
MLSSHPINDYNGLDYLPAFFHRWLKEPGRIVLLAWMKDRVVALESALLVDGGQTVVFQGRRVVSDLRGSGIAGVLHSHVTSYIRSQYPEVCAVRMSRGDHPSERILSKYRLVAKEVSLSLQDNSGMGAFITELRSKTHSSCRGAVTLSQHQAETLILSDHVISNLLPGKTIINDWEPLKPVEANLEVLRRRELTFIADHESEPSALSLGTPPYAVPYRHDALRVNINIFGHNLVSVCAVFLAQLEALQPKVTGFLILQTYLNPAVWEGFRQFCQNNSRVSFLRDYWEDVILESDL